MKQKARYKLLAALLLAAVTLAALPSAVLASALPLAEPVPFTALPSAVLSTALPSAVPSTALPSAVPFTALPATLLAAESPEPGGEGAPAQTAGAAEGGQIPQPNPRYPEIIPIEMDIESISANILHTMALTAEGNVYTWGRNNHGIYGNGTTYTQSFTLVPVALPGRAVQVAAGQEVSLALLEDGTVYDWGTQSAVASRTDPRNSVPEQYIPARVPVLPAVQSVTANVAAFALTANGTAWSWGTNQNALGRTSGTSPRTPAATKLTNVSGVFNFSTFSLASTQNGVYAWGGNSVTGLSQLLGCPLIRTPSKTSLRDVDEITGTGNTLFVRNSAGRLQAWATNRVNEYGMLGLGHTERVDTFTTSLESGVVKAAASGLASFVLKEDGTLWCAGTNYDGCLGLGEEDAGYRVAEYTQIEALENVVDIVASNGGAIFAKTADGCWWGWGANTGLLAPNSGKVYKTVDSPVLLFAPTGYTPVAPEPGTHTVTLTETWADGAQPDVVNTYEVEDGRPFSALFTTPAGYTAEVTCAENLSINYEAMRVYLYSVTNSFDIVVTYTPETLSGYTPETQKEEQP